MEFRNHEAYNMIVVQNFFTAVQMLEFGYSSNKFTEQVALLTWLHDIINRCFQISTRFRITRASRRPPSRRVRSKSPYPPSWRPAASPTNHRRPRCSCATRNWTRPQTPAKIPSSWSKRTSPTADPQLRRNVAIFGATPQTANPSISTQIATPRVLIFHKQNTSR